MTNVGEVLVGAVSKPEDLEQIEALAKSRGFDDPTMIEDNDVWVFGAKDPETNQIIGASAARLNHLDNSAELLFDYVDPSHQGRGIGKILVNKTIETVQDLIGRDIVVNPEMVEKNPDDFEGIKVRERKLGSGVLLSV